MSRQVVAVVVFLSAALAPTVSAQQPAAPPCAPGDPSASLRGVDRNDIDLQPLTATHEISVSMRYSSNRTVMGIEDFVVSLPPGVRRTESDPQSQSASFRVDTPGPVPVSATWTYRFEGGSGCSASAATTLNIEAAKRPRIVAPRPGRGLMSGFEWRLTVGQDADLRPIEVRLRGVRRARLPRRATPAQTLTYVLHPDDRGFSRDGRDRSRRSAGWRFAFGGYFRGDARISMDGFKRTRRRGFGFDLTFVQGGRLLARTATRGRCRFTSLGTLCDHRTTGR